MGSIKKPQQNGEKNMNKMKRAGIVLLVLSAIMVSGMAYAKHQRKYVYRCVGSISSDHSWDWEFDLKLNIYKKSDGTIGGWDTVKIALEWMGEPMVIEDSDIIRHMVVNEETKEIWYIGESNGRPGHYVLVYLKDVGPAKTDLFTAQSIPDDMSLQEAIDICDTMPVIEGLLWWVDNGPAIPMTVNRGNIVLKIY